MNHKTRGMSPEEMQERRLHAFLHRLKFSDESLQRQYLQSDEAVPAFRSQIQYSGPMQSSYSRWVDKLFKHPEFRIYLQWQADKDAL